MSFLYILAIIFLWIPVKIIFPVKRLGVKKIPKKEPVIIACNHLSMRDILVMGAMFPDRHIHFIAKKELFENKFLRFIFKSLRAISVSRGEFDFNAIKTVVGVLKKNKTIGVYPEGTRNMESTEMLEMKNGVALFALKSNAKIVPMYQAVKPAYFRKNYIYVGEPFDFSDIEGDKINKEKLEKATAKLTAKMKESHDKVFEYIEKNNIKIKIKQKKKSSGKSGTENTAKNINNEGAENITSINKEARTDIAGTGAEKDIEKYTETIADGSNAVTYTEAAVDNVTITDADTNKEALN